MRRSVKKFLLTFFFILAISFVAIGFQMYHAGEQAWEEEASGYPTKHEYIP
jgi:hypothetical protein